MKPFALLPVALILGLLIGSWAPRSEIRRLEKDLASARKASRTAASGTARLTGVATLLGIDTGAQTSPTRTEEDSAPFGAPVATMDVARVASNLSVEEREAMVQNDPVGTNAMLSPDAFRNQIENAAKLWRMRSDVARATFASDAELGKQDQDHLDVLLEAMNVRLAGRIEEWVGQVESGMDPGVEAGIRLVREVTDVMTLTYDELDRKLEPGWRENAETPLNLTDFIDPEVALPFVDVQDKLDSHGSPFGLE